MKIVLVDKNDNIIGSEEKLKVHKKGLLHRAFSIFLFNDKLELLIHKRAENKYHSPNLWTNSCCSHQKKDENLNIAIHRRLKEELGIDTELFELFKFHYNEILENGLIENEIDHVFVGKYNGKFNINKDEISEIKFIKLRDLKSDIKVNKDIYTVWFRIIINKYYENIEKGILKIRS